ncbi:hypothetical protein EI94DRAFT_1806964 [Lactarius quietus]|nr:hypothetical protein EI94DRAFT_1806964 [Lactarius quietus]
MALLQRSLSSLPCELIEEIIVITALIGDTRAAATLAQTCRSFRALIYHQFHKHLWREMFLILFDHPFPARDARTHGRVPLPYSNPGKRNSRSCPSEDVFSWEAEYKRRIWTESFILRRTRPSQGSSSELPSTDVEIHAALQTLLRVVSTAAPLPNDALASMESHSSHTTRPHPICSPLFVTAHMYPTLVPISRNIAWLARILAHGLPHALMARLNVFNEHGEVDVQKRSVEWDGLLAKLVAQIGLTTLIGTAPLLDEPTAQSDRQSQEPHDVDQSSSSDDSDFQPECDTTSESDDEGMSEIDGDEVFGTLATPATTSLDGVRRLARIRVYNMAYLHPSRAFGPFLPIDRTSSGQVPARDSLPMRRKAMEQREGRQMVFLHDQDEDAVSLSSSRVPGDQLRFDWAWIAAARQVIELNLRDLLMTRHRDVLRALISLEGLRPCSVPGFPLTVPDWSAAEGDGSGDGDMQYRDGEGWDWAGVEGQWRRCVCWLDYGDLLCNNSQPLAKRFSHPALYEVMRIIPLTIRISHYTRAPAAWPGRPTIHVVGEWHTVTPPALTRLRGTVEMAATGDVRWTLTSSREDGEGEWASEGVQLGGRGSAMGVIGMWTGAEHEPSDPLGPFWAWKVGPATAAVTSTK